MEAGTPLEMLVGKGPTHPPVQSRRNLHGGDTGEAAFIFFLDLVILGEMTGVLLLELTGAAAGAGAAAADRCCRLLPTAAAAAAGHH